MVEAVIPVPIANYAAALTLRDSSSLVGVARFGGHRSGPKEFDLTPVRNKLESPDEARGNVKPEKTNATIARGFAHALGRH